MVLTFSASAVVLAPAFLWVVCCGLFLVGCLSCVVCRVLWFCCCGFLVVCFVVVVVAVVVAVVSGACTKPQRITPPQS